MKKGMFYKADPLIFFKARELRDKLTPAEQVFWLRLKEQFLMYKFRRQHPIDGSVHNSEKAKLNDEKRQNDLKK